MTLHALSRPSSYSLSLVLKAEDCKEAAYIQDACDILMVMLNQSVPEASTRQLLDLRLRTRANDTVVAREHVAVQIECGVLAQRGG